MQKNFISFIFVFLCTLFISGCASITTGQNQTVSVNTENESNCLCTLKNDKGTWNLPSTPASISINRSQEDLVVICHKAGKMGSSTVKSSCNEMVYGNMIIGGLIGTAIDYSNGSAYNYPSQVTVILK